jgi:hypothetical protein
MGNSSESARWMIHFVQLVLLVLLGIMDPILPRFFGGSRLFYKKYLTLEMAGGRKRSDYRFN